MFSGLIARSTFHFYMSFISKPKKNCMELLVLCWLSLLLFFAESRHTHAKHNTKNAGKYLHQTTEDSSVSNMTNLVRLSKEVRGTFCGLCAHVDGDWKSQFHFSQ